jgi:hypothetical protein
MFTPAKEIISNFTHIRIPSFIGNPLSFHHILYKPESQTYLPALVPFLNQSAIFVGSVVGFLNVCTSGSASPKGGTIKIEHVLAGELRHYGELTYASLPPPCRLNIIFDLEMVLQANSSINRFGPKLFILERQGSSWLGHR